MAMLNQQEQKSKNNNVNIEKNINEMKLSDKKQVIERPREKDNMRVSAKGKERKEN